MSIQTKTMTVKSDTSLAETTTTIRDTVTFDVSNMPNGITYKGLKAVLSFADPIQWNKASTYDALTVVWDDASHGSYASKRPVPANIELTNEFYWLRTADLDAQVEMYRQEVREMDARVTANTSAIAAETARAEAAEEKTVLEYDTVSEMLADTHLSLGKVCVCKSFNTDTMGLKYKITNDSANGLDKLTMKNGLTASLIISNCVYVDSLGCYGDGIHDDYNAINRAFALATENVKGKVNPTGTTYDIIPVIFGSKRYAISSGIEITDQISIIGNGIESTIIPLNNLDYVFYIHNEASKTSSVNEENMLLAPQIKNICVDGNARKYTIKECFKLEFCDNAVIDTVWFKAVSGTCISLGTVRESNIRNIYSRFCGTSINPIISIFKKDGDNSNLSFFSELSIIFPFGDAIYCSDSNYTANNVLVHGMFDTIVNSLESLFPNGNNSYTATASFIELVNSKAYINNLNAIYVPGGGSGVYIDVKSECNLNTAQINGVYKTTGTPTAIKNAGNCIFFNLSSGLGYDYKIVTNVDNGKSYGQFELETSNTTDSVTLPMYSDSIELRSYNGYQSINRANHLINLKNSAFEIERDKYVAFDNSKDIPLQHKYIMQYQNAALMAIDDTAAFAIPTYNDETFSIISSYFTSNLLDGILYIHNGHLYTVINNTETLIK